MSNQTTTSLPRTLVMGALLLTAPLAHAMEDDKEQAEQTAEKTGYVPTKQEMATQADAVKWSEQVARRLAKSPQNALAALQHLKQLHTDGKIGLVYDPLPLLKNFALALSQHGDSYLKLLTAQTAQPFVDAAYILNRRVGKAPEDKQRQDILDKLDRAIEGMQRKQESDPFAHQTDFAMQRLRAAVGMLREDKSIALQLGEETLDVTRQLMTAVVSEAAMIATGRVGGFGKKLTALGKEKAKQAWGKAVRCYRDTWYVRTVDMRLRAVLAPYDATAVATIQRPLSVKKKVGSPDWQVFYAGIDALRLVAEQGDKQTVKAVFEGADKDLLGLNQLASHRFKWKNAWRVQAKVAEATILLAAHKNASVQQRAEELVKKLQNSEFPEVKAIVQHRKDVLKAHQLLQQPWEEEKDLPMLHKKLQQGIASVLNELRQQFTAVHGKLDDLKENQEEALAKLDDMRARLQRTVTKGTLHQALQEPWMEKIRAVSESQWEQMQTNGLLRDIEKLYVSPRAKPSRAAQPTLDLQQEVDKFLNDQNGKVFLILSDRGGSGKSVYMQLLERLLWKELEENKLPWIPVYIPLNTVADPSKLVQEVLTDRMGLKDPAALKAKQPMVFLLDGFDEIAQKKQLNLYRRNNLIDWRKSKVIITSRDENLPDDYATRYFAPYKEAGTKGLQSLYIAEFGKEHIRQYLQNYLALYKTGWSVADYMDQIESMNTLSYDNDEGLSRVPIFLRLIAESLPRLAQNSQSEKVQTDNNSATKPKSAKRLDVTSYELFETFVQIWFEREYTKHRDEVAKVLGPKKKATKKYWRYAMELAHQMTRDGKIAFVHQPADKTDSAEKDPFDSDSEEEEDESSDEQPDSYWDALFPESAGYTPVVKAMMFRGVPLCTDRGNEHTYRFWHQKLQAFFDAKKEEGFLQKSRSKGSKK